MARIAQPLADYLRDAREDADFALKLVESGDPQDAALLEQTCLDLVKSLTNAAQGLRRRSSTFQCRDSQLVKLDTGMSSHT